MLDQTGVLNHCYADCRCMLLELAATLDRLDRAPAAPPGTRAADERVRLLQQMIRILAQPSAQADRSARMLHLLSDPVG